MKILSVILRIIVGLVFVLSAYVKLYPIELIEVAMVETGMIGWTLAPFAARILVGFELLLGLMLITGLYARFFLKISLITLVFFTVYLIFLLVFQGNNTNCNCFGLFLAMTPLESILKNMVLMLMLIFLLFGQKKGIRNRFRLYAAVAVSIVSFVLVFILAPIIIGTSHISDEELNYKLPLEIIYNDPDADQPSEKLDEGKHIIVFLSSSCQHCIVVGYKLHVLKTKHNQLPVYFFINGDEDDIRDFHFKTKSYNIPYSSIKAGVLIALAGNRLPAIFWLDNGYVVNKQTFYELSEKEILEWLDE
jgi:uncharacterized membrane protein YphA (DoxX/SURF4 family)